MNAKQALNTDRWATSTLTLGKKRFDELTQFLPRDYLVHLFQKSLAPREFTVFIESFGKAFLFHCDNWFHFNDDLRIISNQINKSEIPYEVFRVFRLS